MYSFLVVCSEMKAVLKGKCMKHELKDLLAGGKLLSHYLECDWFDIYL